MYAMAQAFGIFRIPWREELSVALLEAGSNIGFLRLLLLKFKIIEFGKNPPPSMNLDIPFNLDGTNNL